MKRSLYRLIETLDDDTTVVTGTARLARELRLARARCEIILGRAGWRTPDIVPFSAWVRRSWQEHQERSFQPLPNLLTPLQERCLWEVSILDDLSRRGVSSLLNVPGAARQAGRANAILDDWCNGAPDNAAAGLWVGEDAMAFREWRKRIHRRCHDERWVVSSAVTSLLSEHFSQNTERLPSRLVFAGFHVMTHAQRRLLNVLSAAGVEITTENPGLGDVVGQKVSFAQSGDELEAVARWAGALLERGAGSVGVVVPELVEKRTLVEHRFEDVLGSGQEYEISATPALSRVPVVRDALLVLRAIRDTLSITELEQILRSPFIRNAHEEFHQRSMLVGVLRRMGKPEISPARIGRHLQTTPGLANAVAKALLVRKSWPGTQSMARWTVAMSQWLNAFGWPGEGADTQAVEQFRDVLTDLAGLGMVIGTGDVYAALSKLERMCAERSHRVHSVQAPVQVLTIDESIGLEFEHLWITGLHDGVWPAGSRPNPFLPGGWLRRYQVPHSSPDWELDFAARITTMWSAAAGRVVFSHPLQQGDLVLRASPVLRALDEPDLPLPGSAVVTRRQQLRLNRPGMERLRDFTAPPVSKHETIRGGSSVFKNQAACRFRGFAIHRLGADTLEMSSPGLDALDRGSLVHDVLALVWKKISTHAELIQYSDLEIQTLVGECVDDTFGVWARHRPGLLEGQFADLERDRLTHLVGSWLAVEKQRPAFVVVAFETDTRARVGDIPITIRPDRIDRLDDGGLLIIDYKSGDAHRNSWFGERMDEPQLPLYCTAIDAGEERVAGVTFALVKMGKTGFSGVAGRDGLGPGITHSREVNATDWPTLKSQWRDSLDGLAREFLAGDATVAPKSATSCRYCRVWALCRIREIKTLEADAEEMV